MRSVVLAAGADETRFAGGEAAVEPQAELIAAGEEGSLSLATPGGTL